MFKKGELKVWQTWKNATIGALATALVSVVGYFGTKAFGVYYTQSEHQRQLEAHEAAIKLLNDTKVDRKEHTQALDRLEKTVSNFIESQKEINGDLNRKIDRLDDRIYQQGADKKKTSIADTFKIFNQYFPMGSNLEPIYIDNTGSKQFSHFDTLSNIKFFY
jgi:hypothetical protein